MSGTQLMDKSQDNHILNKPISEAHGPSPISFFKSFLFIFFQKKKKDKKRYIKQAQIFSPQ